MPFGRAQNFFPPEAYAGPPKLQITIADLLTVRYGPHDDPTDTPARIARRWNGWCLVEWEKWVPPLLSLPGTMAKCGLWYQESHPGLQARLIDLTDRAPEPKGRRVTIEEEEDDDG